MGVYTDQSRQKADTLLRDVDSAARAGLRYASTLLLVADIITRSFQEVESGNISREDTGRVVTLLGPLSRLVFDQFSRTAVRSVRARRDMVLDAVKWPYASMRNTLERLPIIGGDLFGGRLTRLQSQATKLKSLKEAGLQVPTQAPPKQQNRQSRSSFPTGRSNRNEKKQGRGRGSQNQPQRQQSFDRPRGGRGRGWFRGGFKPNP